MSKKVTKGTAGRKSIMTQSTLGKLREAFLWGCSDREACLYAGINPDTLYAYQKKNPQYSEQKECFKTNPIMLARKCVVNALAEDPQLALKYLERKKSAEFSLKQTVEQNVSNDRIVGINYIVPDDSILTEDRIIRVGDTVTRKSDITNP